MPEHSVPPVENFVPSTFQDAVWLWRQISTGTQAEPGWAARDWEVIDAATATAEVIVALAAALSGGVTAVGAPDRWLFGALGSGKSTSFVVGGEDR